jgi:hypothetical protein
MGLWSALLAPEAQPDAYVWLVVLLAHAFLGLTLTALVAPALARWTAMLPLPSAVQIVSLVYAVGWEGLVQQLGAGLLDAAVDTLAVVCGALIAWGAWSHLGRKIAAALLVLLAVGGAGVWRRRK